MDDKLKKFSVIIIENDKLVQKLVFDVLTKLGFANIYKADNGVTALDMLENHPVDFIICDWRMARMSGLEIVKRIRKAGTSVNPLIPIIMLTGNAEAHQVVEARDAGVNEYLIKPFTVNELCKRVMEIVDRPREFVLDKHFQGPSRRRKSLVISSAKERRKSRVKPIKVSYARKK